MNEGPRLASQHAADEDTHPARQPDELGRVEVIFGPMYSGKTSELIRRIRRLTFAGKRCVIVKHALDTRYDCAASVSTHDLQVYESRVASSLMSLLDELAGCCDVIGIDEGQFFDDIVGFAEAAANKGKIVIVATLDGTFQRRPFGAVLGLVPIAESVTKLTAICTVCRKKDAAFSKRIVESTEVVLVGARESYVAACRDCYFALSSRPVPGAILAVKTKPDPQTAVTAKAT